MPFILIFIFNGDNVLLDEDEDLPLYFWLLAALRESGNDSRPVDDWQLRTEAGAPLPLDKSPRELALVNGQRFIASLQVAAGGGITRESLEALLEAGARDAAALDKRLTSTFSFRSNLVFR